ncbi:MAG: hypothetical protein H8E64_07730 [Candidatus Marinimicrobia bacterium]|nr:hypothetical protein [Candidatus Neomarinimicrobiota bacterium]
MIFFFGYVGNWWGNHFDIWAFTLSMLKTGSGMSVFLSLILSLIWLIKTSRKIGTIWWI